MACEAQIIQEPELPTKIIRIPIHNNDENQGHIKDHINS